MNKKNTKTKYSFGNYLFYLILGSVVRLVLKIVFGFKLNTDEQVQAWKKQKIGFIVLCAHPSEFDATLLLSAVLPNRARFVAGAQQLYKGVQGSLLRMIKVIPKKQFVPDISSVKEMMYTVKNGMILGMMPEGRVSLDGTENPNDISTAKLIKRMGVPVAILIPHGTYFVKPSYNWAALNKGKVSADFKCLFSAEEIANMTAEEILNKLDAECKYNESEWLRNSKSASVSCMEKVSNILYLCPSCGSLFSMAEDDNNLYCKECGLNLLKQPDNIADWNKMQLDFERDFWRNNAAETEEFNKATIEFNVQKYMLTLGKETDYRKCEEGILSLSKDGLSYKSSEEEILVPLASIPGVSADYMNGYITYYSGDDIRRFALENPQYTTRFVNSLMVLKGVKELRNQGIKELRNQ